jgi:peptidoglycan/LPS O-acetylase OafA/YrhL
VPFFISFIAMMTKPRYFPILDSLRFLASVGVVVSHSTVFFRSSLSRHDPGAALFFPPVVEDAGYFSVVFFYTLSGFLITYLLLKEKENTGTIAVRNFYIRRALRIWPLYYTIILLSFFVFPHLIAGHPGRGTGPWMGPFLLYLFFLPNVAVLGGFYLASCFHTYTIGYEEQFYLFWPLLLRKARRSLGYVLAGLYLLPWGADLIRVRVVAGEPALSPGAHFAGQVLNFISLSNLPAFAAGTAAALLYLGYFGAGRRVLAFAGSRLCRYGLMGGILLLLYFTVPGPPGYANGVSVLFALLILNLVVSGAQGGWIGAALAKGGRISYGIYMYHVAVLIFVSFFMARFHIGSPGRPMLSYLAYLAVSFGVLLPTAFVSRRYLEGYFLRRKGLFEPDAAIGGRVGQVGQGGGGGT